MFLNQKQLEAATPWELRCQLEGLQRDTEHAESWLKELGEATSVLKIAIRQKSDKPGKIFVEQM